MSLSYTLCCVGADALRSRPSETGDTMPLSTAPRRVATAVLAALALPAALAACGGVGGVVTSQTAATAPAPTEAPTPAAACGGGVAPLQTAAAESIDYWAADERARAAVERARAAVERAKERAEERARAAVEHALAAAERAEAEGDTDAAAEHTFAALLAGAAAALTLSGPNQGGMAEIDAERAARAAMMAERHARDAERHARDAEREAGAVLPALPARGESIDYWAAVDRALAAAACAGASADSMAELHAEWAGKAALRAESAAREAESAAREVESAAREAEAAAHGP